MPPSNVAPEAVAEIARLGEVTGLGNACVAALILKWGTEELAGRKSLGAGPRVRFAYLVDGDGTGDVLTGWQCEHLEKLSESTGGEVAKLASLAVTASLPKIVRQFGLSDKKTA